MAVRRPCRVNLTVQLMLVLALSGACARAAYICARDIDLPGVCPPDTVKHGTFDMIPDSTAPRDSIVGRVVARFDGKPVQNARVTITADTAIGVLTDSAGRFAAPRPASSWIVRATMIGYRPRVDTIIADRSTQTRLQIGLEAQGTDGPCSGYVVVCRKRP